MRSRKRAILAVIGSLLFLSCGFDEFQPAEPGVDEVEDTGNADGIKVSPAVIHPGERVALSDPVVPDPNDRVPLYYWDACDGVIEQEVPSTGEATWIAPEQPGIYSISVNITNVVRDNPSRVLSLCVAPPGKTACAGAPNTDLPETVSLTATPSEMRQDSQCPDRCESTLDTGLSGTVSEVTFLWQARHGLLHGAGASVRWSLPVVGCCTEFFTAAVTVCDANGGAATGVTGVLVMPD